MKRRLVALVGVFCVACLITSGAYAGKPTDKPDKPGKPPRPGNIAIECIEFTGDLESVPLGGTVVEGCCPNAGPNPAYTMTLWLEGLPEASGKAFEGQLFAKPVRTKFKGQTTVRYKVQFWTWDWNARQPGTGDYFFQIYADEECIEYDETTEVLTVAVEDWTATVWEYFDMAECDPCDPECDLCFGFDPPACDDFCDPDCRPYPCNNQIAVDNVSFVMTKTSDLSYCQD